MKMRPGLANHDAAGGASWSRRAVRDDEHGCSFVSNCSVLLLLISLLSLLAVTWINRVKLPEITQDTDMFTLICSSKWRRAAPARRSFVYLSVVLIDMFSHQSETQIKGETESEPYCERNPHNPNELGVKKHIIIIMMGHEIIIINDNILMITVLFGMVDFTQLCSV